MILLSWQHLSGQLSFLGSAKLKAIVKNGQSVLLGIVAVAPL
jgi:hypothetical protein